MAWGWSWGEAAYLGHVLRGCRLGLWSVQLGQHLTPMYPCVLFRQPWGPRVAVAAD
jgi:hypothetical protein